MLRSFAYAAQRERAAPRRPRARGLGGARARGVPGGLHRRTSTRRCCPPARPASSKLLSIFELEKAVYELRYELNNRPDWVRIPVAGIARLLEAPLPT